jgi:hypothetical protein
MCKSSVVVIDAVASSPGIAEEVDLDDVRRKKEVPEVPA